ncbi:hypothetical protein ONZ51_g7257 [Trametes cubensis]|uniref:Transmembrane protein n=1 Tax=Trametes cubensis TaxID=1111947 RepID=A0AAD7TQV3_9APHY|nr:hypothetical protein ONZ51_g7257 [Trametes cubensis]
MLACSGYLAFSAFTCLRVYGIWGRDWKPLLVVFPSLSIMKLILAVVKTYGILRESLCTGLRTPLSTLLLYDAFIPGTAYFLFMLCAQLATLLPVCMRYSTIGQIWLSFSQVLTNIAVSRLILNLRGLYFANRAGCEAETSLHLSNVRLFGLNTANIVGNLGETPMLPAHSAEPDDVPPFDAHGDFDDPQSTSHSKSASSEWALSKGETELMGMGIPGTPRCIATTRSLSGREKR